jgi:ppGpp synthetase/RelA/SpoT-type nucleotidyltranferase
MQIDQDFPTRYDEACEDLRDLGPVVVNLVRELLRARSIRVHSVNHRIKVKKDVRRKLNEKGDAYTSLADMHDLLGVRIITFFPDEVDTVSEVVENQFAVDFDNSVDKRELLDPDRFGYLSQHYVVAMHEKRAGLTEHARFADRKFEIQIRSILQHAWAEIEHDLGYHSREAVPKDIRRRFSRLAGLLEIADDEFEAIRDEVATYQGTVSAEVAKNPSLVPVNRDSMAALIKSNALIHAVDSELASLVGVEVRPPPNEEAAANSRAEVMLAVDLRTIGAVTDALEQDRAALVRFFRAWTELGAKPEFVPKGLSVFMLGYLRAAPHRSRDQMLSYLDRAGIGFGAGEREQIVTRVLAALEAADSGSH